MTRVKLTRRATSRTPLHKDIHDKFVLLFNKEFARVSMVYDKLAADTFQGHLFPRINTHESSGTSEVRSKGLGL